MSFLGTNFTVLGKPRQNWTTYSNYCLHLIVMSDFKKPAKVLYFILKFSEKTKLMSGTANLFFLSVDALKGQQFAPMSIAKYWGTIQWLVDLCNPTTIPFFLYTSIHILYHPYPIHIQGSTIYNFSEIILLNWLANLLLRLTQDTILFSMEQERRSHSFCLHVLYNPL